nr:DUF4158 domain-containing protein [Streptomyces katrae]
MPVEFLTDDQAGTYGKFAEEPTRPESERFFFLDDVDRDLIALRRTKHHQLGFALQRCTVRYMGLSSTATSTSWAVTASPPPLRLAAPYARFATRTQWNSTRTTRGSGSGP